MDDPAYTDHETLMEPDEARAKLVKYPADILSSPAMEVTQFDKDLARSVEQLFEICRLTGGVGLAAVQIGIPYRLFVVDTRQSREVEEDKALQLVVCNPEIIDTDGKLIKQEGCLSIPSVFVPIVRFDYVKFRGQDIAGRPIEIGLRGFNARVIQHETDHCNGILCMERAPKLYRETIRKKIAQARRKGEW